MCDLMGTTVSILVNKGGVIARGLQAQVWGVIGVVGCDRCV